MKSNVFQKRIGLIGVGLMGEPIARRILNGGYSLRIWNRTLNKCESLLKDGAILSKSPKEMAKHVDVVLLFLKDEFAVEEVLFGADGLFSVDGDVRLIADHSTICPTKIKNIVGQLEKIGVKYLDAPVTGSVSGAINGSLTGFFGGDSNDIDSIRHILCLYIKKINYMGENSMGQAAKVCNQTVLLNMIISIFEMINLARKQGIDDAMLLSAFEDSLFDCKAWQIYGHAAVSKQEKKLAPIRNVMKDLSYIYKIGNLKNSPTYLTETSLKLVSRLMERGMGDEDILKLIKVYSD